MKFKKPSSVIKDLLIIWRVNFSLNLIRHLRFNYYLKRDSESVGNYVCPEGNDELFECISDSVTQETAWFYAECLDYIDEIFRNGHDDLKLLLG